MRRVAALCLLVVLAGCTGGGNASLTVTPAPVPTDAADRSPVVGLAPGVTTSGAVNAVVLAGVHARTLRTTAYEVRVTEVVRRGDRSVRTTTMTGVFSGSRTNYYQTFDRTTVRSNGDEVVEHWEVYADGERLLEAIVTENETRYYVPRRSFSSGRAPEILGHPAQRDQLFAALTAVNVTLAGETEVDGRTAYRLTGDELREASFLAAWEYVDSVESASVELVVTRRGIVREYRSEYEARHQSRTVTVVRTATFSAVGDATVDPPDWYGEALDRTGEG